MSFNTRNKSLLDDDADKRFNRPTTASGSARAVTNVTKSPLDKVDLIILMD